MKLEACIESLSEARLAAHKNLNRVELCSALDLGGLTPPEALTKACAEVIEVHAMVRPRAGGFVYSDDDISLMLQEIETLKDAGAVGVVFGCLNQDNTINIKQTKLLTTKAKSLGLVVTFHRAIDFVENQVEALETLVGLQIDRVLTSGGAPQAKDSVENIAKLVEASANKIEIMAGSGVDKSCAKALQETGIHGLHFTLRKQADLPVLTGMGVQYDMDHQKLNDILGVVK